MNLSKLNFAAALSAAAVLAGCCTKTAPVVTFAEADDPTAVAADAWSGVKKGLSGAWGSADMLYSRSEVPQLDAEEVFRTSAWRGERVSAQIVLWTGAGADGVKCNIGDFRSESAVIPSSAAQARFVRYTLADKSEPQCLCGRKDNHPAVLVPDMLDTLSSFDMAANTVRPVWITVNIPSDAAAGTYRSEVTVTRNGMGKVKLPIEIEVQDRLLPPASEWRYHLDLWQHPAAVARAEGVELWSDAHFEALRRQMKMLADAGQKVVTATLNKDPWNHQCYDAYEDMIRWTRHADGKWSYDYKIFDRWVELMFSLGINRMINCYSMLPWNCELVYNDEATGKMVTVKAEPSTPEFARMWEPFLRDFKVHLEQKGWLGITNIAMDERSPEDMDKAVKILMRCAPEMGFALADNHYSYKRYNMMRDVCVAQRQQVDPEDLAARRAVGFSTTYYVCCSTHFPNVFTFSQPWEANLLGWYGVAWDFDGMLRWAYNSWPADPQYDSRFGHFASGDTYMVYPAGRSSMRFERMVDGIESAEKVRILRDEAVKSGNAEALKALDAILAKMRGMNVNDQSLPWHETTREADEALRAASL